MRKLRHHPSLSHLPTAVSGTDVAFINTLPPFPYYSYSAYTSSGVLWCLYICLLYRLYAHGQATACSIGQAAWFIFLALPSGNNVSLPPAVKSGAVVKRPVGCGAAAERPCIVGCIAERQLCCTFLFYIIRGLWCSSRAALHRLLYCRAAIMLYLFLFIYIYIFFLSFPPPSGVKSAGALHYPLSSFYVIIYLAAWVWWIEDVCDITPPPLCCAAVCSRIRGAEPPMCMLQVGNMAISIEDTVSLRCM